MGKASKSVAAGSASESEESSTSTVMKKVMKVMKAKPVTDKNKVRKGGSGRPLGSLGKKKNKGYQVSRRTLRRRVFNGLLDHTPGGLQKSAFMVNHRGKIVSKKMNALGKKRPWMVAVVQARKALAIKGLAMVKKGTPLYKKAKEFMETNKKK